MDCVEPPCKEFCSLRCIIKLWMLSLWASLKFVAVLLIALIRSSGLSKMHLKAVIPRMGRGMKTGGALYF